MYENRQKRKKTNENVWKWTKTYENGQTLVKMDEKKMDENVQKNGRKVWKRKKTGEHYWKRPKTYEDEGKRIKTK